MKDARHTRSAIVAVIAMALTTSMASGARADESTREAGKHFQRGVALYGETDYRAALVEFKRAYALSPNAAVLYNIGETEYQLQDYAGALTTFEHYLAEAAPSDPHRAEVDSTIDILHARVGRVSVVTMPAGADVTIDDLALGKTPLDKSQLVSIGRRKIVASMPGRAPVTRTVDVATDDNLVVTLVLPASADSPSSSSSSVAPALATHDVPPPSNGGATWRTVGWVSTGVLASGAITFALLAKKESGDLKTARETFPVSPATLSHDAGVTTTYSILADTMAVAALVVGGVTLFSTVTSSSSPASPKRETASAARVSLGPGSARLDLSF